MWNPTQYARFADERSRPFFELVDRIGAIDPGSVIDLGCGSGALSATLAERWPTAAIVGVDSDAAMLAAASQHATDRVSFEPGDIATWRPANPVDVIVSNAAFQWVPGHLGMLPDLGAHLSPGGWLAFQVPGNLDDPHHQAIREVRRRDHWAAQPSLALLPERTHSSSSAVTYTDRLANIGYEVDAWETTYVHILNGVDPILEWVKGTGLRPVLNALPDDASRAEFCAELAPLLREAYPTRPYGTPFPFRRVFVVARRTA